jgi:hypothetical protein
MGKLGHLLDAVMSAVSAGRERMRRPAVSQIILAVVFAVVVPAGSGLAEPKAAKPPDLADIEQFRARFNQDVGTPRLVLLLSPT